MMVGRSDVGLRRDHNEDSIAVDPNLGLVVLADGMGGYKAGEVASAIAVNVVMEEVRNSLKQELPEVTDQETGLCRGSLLVRNAIGKANDAIYETAQKQPQCQGMGTTVVAVLFYNNRMSIAHVGDSRLYRLRGGRLEQITVDHSLLQELIDKGFYTEEEAKSSNQKNLVTRAMGVEPGVEAEIQEKPVEPGDIYLLCSDGLSDLVSDEEIHLTLEEYSANLDEAADTLIQKANRQGGSDNIRASATSRRFDAGFVDDEFNGVDLVISDISVYDAADLFVMLSRTTPTRLEGFGLTYLQAAARGLPSLACSVGGVPEAVRHGETGWVLPAEAGPRAVGAALARILEDEELRRRLGEAARRRSRHFTHARYASDVYRPHRAALAS